MTHSRPPQGRTYHSKNSRKTRPLSMKEKVKGCFVAFALMTASLILVVAFLVGARFYPW